MYYPLGHGERIFAEELIKKYGELSAAVYLSMIGNKIENKCNVQFVGEWEAMCKNLMGEKAYSKSREGRYEKYIERVKRLQPC